MDFSIVLPRDTQHLNNFSIRAVCVFRPALKSHYHLLLVGCARKIVQRYKEIRVHPGVGWTHKSKGFVLVYNTDEISFFALKYTCYLSLGPASPLFLEELYLHRVPVKCPVQVGKADKNIILKFFSTDIGIALCIHIYDTGIHT